MPLIPETNEQRMPTAAIAVVIVVSLLPFLLILAGIKLGSPPPPPAVWVPGSAEAAYGGLVGNFVHTVLEWSAVCVALLTVLLAFLHFHEKGESTMPIIGLAWLCAGLIDMGHTLGANRLIPVAASHEAFTEFTWLLSRTANAGILLLGAAIFLLSGPIHSRAQRKRDIQFVSITTGLVALAALAIVYVCATRPTLPFNIRPDALVSRPLELIPLALYALAAGMVLPAFYRWHPSVFTHSLWVGMIPHMAAQLHMAFGSEVAFDAHYHAAHFLKVIAYGVPMVGLLMEYRLAHAEYTLAQEERAGEFFVRQQAEQALAGDRSVLRILMEHSPEMISIKDASLRYTRANKSQARFMGVEHPRDVIGKSDADFFDAATAEAARKRDARVLSSGEALTAADFEGVRKDRHESGGVSFRQTISVYPLKNEEGAVLGLVTISRTR
jgi:PAS domain-containing protein